MASGRPWTRKWVWVAGQGHLRGTLPAPAAPTGVRQTIHFGNKARQPVQGQGPTGTTTLTTMTHPTNTLANPHHSPSSTQGLPSSRPSTKPRAGDLMWEVPVHPADWTGEGHTQGYEVLTSPSVHMNVQGNKVISGQEQPCPRNTSSLSLRWPHIPISILTAGGCEVDRAGGAIGISEGQVAWSEKEASPGHELLCCRVGHISESLLGTLTPM
jgi:hypothetical protein